MGRKMISRNVAIHVTHDKGNSEEALGEVVDLITRMEYLSDKHGLLRTLVSRPMKED